MNKLTRVKHLTQEDLTAMLSACEEKTGTNDYGQFMVGILVGAHNDLVDRINELQALAHSHGEADGKS